MSVGPGPCGGPDPCGQLAPVGAGWRRAAWWGACRLTHPLFCVPRIMLICAKRSLFAAFSVLPYGDSFELRYYTTHSQTSRVHPPPPNHHPPSQHPPAHPPSHSPSLHPWVMMAIPSVRRVLQSAGGREGGRGSEMVQKVLTCVCFSFSSSSSSSSSSLPLQ